MSDQDNIFKPADDGSQAPTPPAQNDDTNSTDQLLQAIQNEQGVPKYKDVADALKALKASQDHIARLEEENSGFKTKVTESATLQAVLDALKPQADSGSSTPPALDEATIASLVESVVTKRDSVKQASTNAAAVAGKFVELYGDKGETEFYAQAEAKGLSREWINKLAAENPATVFKVLGITDKRGTTPMGSSQNPAAFKDTPNQPKKFDPFTPSDNSSVAKWRESSKGTNERLGISE